MLTLKLIKNALEQQKYFFISLCTSTSIKLSKKFELRKKSVYFKLSDYMRL